MEILAAVYYLIGLFLTLPNIYIVFNGVNWLDGIKQSANNEDEEKSIDFFGCLFVIPTIIWFMVGLLTAQWLFFLSYLILSGLIYFIRDRFLTNGIEKLIYRFASLLELAFIFFVVLNHFHFHLTVSLV